MKGSSGITKKKGYSIVWLVHFLVKVGVGHGYGVLSLCIELHAMFHKVRRLGGEMNHEQSVNQIKRNETRN